MLAATIAIGNHEDATGRRDTVEGAVRTVDREPHGTVVVYTLIPTTACAAATRAIGTRNGEQLT